MICGILTGCVDGHEPPVLVPEKIAGPFVGYATWDLWSGESRFLPSQHLEVCQFGETKHSVVNGCLRRVEDVATDATGARLGREALGVQAMEVSRNIGKLLKWEHTWRPGKVQHCLRQSWAHCSSGSKSETLGPWIHDLLHRRKAYGSPSHCCQQLVRC